MLQFWDEEILDVRGKEVKKINATSSRVRPCSTKARERERERDTLYNRNCKNIAQLCDKRHVTTNKIPRSIVMFPIAHLRLAANVYKESHGLKQTRCAWCVRYHRNTKVKANTA